MSSPSPRLISLRHHKRGHINFADFHALKKFEKLHPEMYQRVRAPAYSRNNLMENMATQMDAFNAVFEHPAFKEEFMSMIEAEKK